jgi:hypothetical protein
MVSVVGDPVASDRGDRIRMPATRAIGLAMPWGATIEAQRIID